MYRIIHLTDTYDPPSLTARLTAKARACLEACTIEIRARMDERRLRDADPRMLEDVGLTHCAVARGALRGRRGGDDVALLVRDSSDAHVSAIAAIYGHWVLHGLASFELDPPHMAEMGRRRAAISIGGYPYLVAQEPGGTVLGHAYASAYRTRPAYRFAVENSVYVAPDATGSGAGRALLSALVNACQAHRFRVMVAVIGDSGNAPSIGPHTALGFRRAGLLPAVGWKHGRWVDSVLMVRLLGPGPASPPEEFPT